MQWIKYLTEMHVILFSHFYLEFNSHANTKIYSEIFTGWYSLYTIILSH